MASEIQKIDTLDPRRRFGNRGEDLAAAFFIQRGFEVVERNWSCRVGEIDLICRKGNAIHFIEVKTRRTTAYGNPEDAITPTKLRHFRRAIEAYLQQSKNPPREYQADALAILAEPGKKTEFHYIENIFG